ncbi:hypothetical protein GH714_031808 [Hevea brasiliensis]|uniref:Uncharacterized protein n=1 Tax=Hevea brasiliensis TaxID=3981 RepID=A0A6A6M611_HEVBR|nr:hypothetical protein GH714_031808 [Hevea brasiliensis]
MAESTKNQTEMVEKEDYMGDLSQLLPHEASNSSTFSAKEAESDHRHLCRFQATKPQLFNYPRRSPKPSAGKNSGDLKERITNKKRMDKIGVPIPQSNIGIVKANGLYLGSTFGKGSSGRAELVGIEIRWT